PIDPIGPIGPKPRRQMLNLRLLLFVIFLALTVSVFAASRELKFKHHFLDTDLPGINYGLTDCADIGHDGHPAFITGGKDKDKTIYWFEFRGPDAWKRHVLGTDHPSDVGGKALDVDGDGWIDFVTGGVWY